MQVQEQIVEGIHVLKIVGEIDLAVSPELRRILGEHAKACRKALVLDCAGVGYVDSSGLATLIEYVRNAQQFQGKFALAGVTDRVRTVIELVRLHDFLSIFPSVEEAIKALAPQAAS